MNKCTLETMAAWQSFKEKLEEYRQMHVAEGLVISASYQ